MAVFSYYQQARIFVFINFSQNQYLERFHEKSVVLTSDHRYSPFPAPFLIQEMRTRGFHPWYTDRPIPHLLGTTYTVDDLHNNDEDALDDNGGGGRVADLGGDTGVGFSGSGAPILASGVALTTRHDLLRSNLKNGYLILI